MSSDDTNLSSENIHSRLLCLEDMLQSSNKEKEKLQTRLLGYETVAKLASEKQNENKELKKRVDELERENEHLKTKKTDGMSKAPMEETGSSQSVELTAEKTKAVQVLADLQPLTSSASSILKTGSSSSFAVIGKSSREIHNPPLELLPLMKIPVEDFGLGDLRPLEITPPSPDKKISLSPRKTSLIDKTENGQFSICPKPLSTASSEKSLNSDILEEYIQVFPQMSQSTASNFSVLSMDQEMNGGISYTNSSRRGPISIIAYPNKSVSPFSPRGRRQETNEEGLQFRVKSDEKEDSTNEINDPYNGTGARPKSATKLLDFEPNTHILPNQKHLLLSEEIKVKIPKEESNEFRINNAPMLSFGRENSQTEISALTSFGSTLESCSPEKVEQEPLQYNELNMSNRSTHTDQERANPAHEMLIPKIPTQEEFIIVESPPSLKKTVTKSSESITDSNSLMLKELDILRVKTQQLHKANKEWNDQWDRLKQEKENENLRLHAQIKHLVHENEQLRKKMEYAMAIQRKELLHLNMSKQELEQTNKVLLSGRGQEKQLLEKLRQDYGALHQEKRALEIKLEDLTVNNSNIDSQKDDSFNKTKLETELAVVKRQVTLFMEDFNKEHEERLELEKKLKKEKETSQSLETKLKRTHALLKSRDEDLRQKSKQLAELQYQVDSLKLKLEIEARSASIYPSIDRNLSPTEGKDSMTVFNPNRIDELVPVNPSTHHHEPPGKRKPSHWSCPACTFNNKMTNKKCAVCHTTYTSTESRYL